MTVRKDALQAGGSPGSSAPGAPPAPGAFRVGAADAEAVVDGAGSFAAAVSSSRPESRSAPPKPMTAAAVTVTATAARRNPGPGASGPGRATVPRGAILVSSVTAGSSWVASSAAGWAPGTTTVS
ncbi:hypothetical protein WKI71_41045 [Streptomyces sp. MS1.AVA.1]|uniref:Uncharacterized protein n=1 Tax=Streptomyces machairae TaxID=3134109 RepID=A0ABU8UVT4_9ACTN